MKVIFLSEQYLTQVCLGEYVSGKYCVTIKMREGIKQEIGAIRGIQNQWLFYLQDEMHKEKKTPLILKENMLQRLYLKKNKEYVLCYVQEQKKETAAYTYYQWQDEIRIGRHKSNNLCIDHPFCSLYHAVLKKDDQQLFLEDLNSSNGVYLNQKRVFHKKLNLGDVIFIAGVTIVIGSGYVAVCNADMIQVHLKLFHAVQNEPIVKEWKKKMNRYPPCRKKEQCEIDLLPPSPAVEKESMPLLYTMGPALTMTAASFCNIYFQLQKAWKNPALMEQLLPALSMSISLLAGTLMWPVLQRLLDRKRNQKMERKREAAYRDYLNEKEEEIHKKMKEEKEAMYQCSFSIKGWVNLLKQYETGILDPQHPMFLNLRIGCCDTVFPILWKTPQQEKLKKDHLDSLYDTFLKKQRKLEHVPYLCDLKKDYFISILTSKQQDIDCFLLQLMVLHQPRNVRVIIFGREEAVKQYRFIPHVRTNAEAIDMITSEEDEMQISKELVKLFDHRENKSSFSQHIVLVSIYHDIAGLAIIHRMQDHAYRGFSYLSFYRSKQDCSLISHLCFDFRTADCAVHHISGEVHHLKREEYTEDISKAAIMLASQQNTASVKSFPSKISLLDLYECQSTEELNILARWSLPYQRSFLQAPLGVKQNRQPIYLNLHESAHGPHGILAGTTGSGKSELILTFLASLAIQYPPDRIVFVLIDFKGGSMAKALQGLPHIAGILTNLNQNEVERTLISLQAEVTKRQQLFQLASQQTQIMNLDIDTYQSLYIDGKVETALPHIVLVCDEFAELKMQFPQVMHALISFARIGRSLGVHLLLATQKPYGVIDDQIWGNSRFHICLKVAQKEDSIDVLKKPDAVTLDGPGKFYFQVGYDEVFEQGLAAYAGWPYDPDRKTYEEDQVEIIDIRGRSLHQTNLSHIQHTSLMKETELDAVISHIRECAQHLAYETEVIWQQTLPLSLSYEESKRWVKQISSSQILLGLCDVPHRQSYEPLLYDLQHTSLCAGVLCDREIMLDTLFKGIEYHSNMDVTTYIFDFEDGNLIKYQTLYHIGAVFLPAEQERIRIFWNALYQKVKRKESTGNVFIVMHHYALWKELYEDVEEQLLYIVREGKRQHIHVLFTISHSTQLPYRLNAEIDDIYVFHLKDKDEYRILLQDDVCAVEAGKGRGYVKRKKAVSMQIMHLPDQLHRTDSIHKASKFPELPAHAYAEAIKDQQIFLGISMETLTPYYQKLGCIWFLYAAKLPHAFFQGLSASGDIVIFDENMKFEECQERLKQLHSHSCLLIKNSQAIMNALGEDTYQILLDQMVKHKLPCIFLEHYTAVFHPIHRCIFHKDDFFWIGAGLQEEGYQIMQDFIKDVDNKIDSAYGYHIQQGTAHKLLLIEKEE